ncbi:sigma 54 modulation/S30EA ribosomal C-terminal domain-containing protein, partial [Chloroflexota bacterium]
FEALEQMELLGHQSFFIFYNANTNNINVLYRRRDGNFGLIEPEIG